MELKLVRSLSLPFFSSLSLSLSLSLSSLGNSELSVQCSFKILFRSRNRRHRLVRSIAMSTNWRHVPTRLEYPIICVIANKKINCNSMDFRHFLKCLQLNLQSFYDFILYSMISTLLCINS